MHVTIHTAQTWADTFISELNDTHVENALRIRHVPPLLDIPEAVSAFKVATGRRLIVLGYNATLTQNEEAPVQPKRHFDQIKVSSTVTRITVAFSGHLQTMSSIQNSNVTCSACRFPFTSLNRSHVSSACRLYITCATNRHLVLEHSACANRFHHAEFVYKHKMQDHGKTEKQREPTEFGNLVARKLIAVCVGHFMFGLG
jgi:hypothetical protein